MYLSVKVNSEKEFDNVLKIFKILGKNWMYEGKSYDADVAYLEYGYYSEDDITWHGADTEFFKENVIISYSDFVSKYDLNSKDSSKIRVINIEDEDESRSVQDALFELGLTWNSRDKHYIGIAPYPVKLFINDRGNGTITYEHGDYDRDPEKVIRYTPKELLDAVKVSMQLKNKEEKVMTKIDLSSLTKQQISAIVEMKDRISGSYYPLYALTDKIRDDAKGFGDDDEHLQEAIDAISDREIELQVVDFLFNKNTEFEIKEEEKFIVTSRFTDRDGDTLYLRDLQGHTTYLHEDAYQFDSFEEATKSAGPFGKVVKE